MNSVFVEFREIANELVQMWEKYRPDDVAFVKENIDEKINQERLSIQIYGNYNSGKSTLVNALLKKHAAKIDDIPTTNRIDSYSWNGYHLLDSPGVNAPIDHESIAESELLKRSLVLFVIRQDDQDASEVYNRIFQQLNKGKQVFIVLNYQGLDAESSGEGSVEKLVGKIFTVLSEEAAKHKTDRAMIRKVKVLPVNLKSAMKGRIEEKALLVERSGFTSFLTQFTDWVASYNNETHFVEDIRQYLLNEVVDPLEKDLQKKTQDHVNLNEARSRLGQVVYQRDDMLGQSASLVRSLVSSAGNQIYEAITTSQSAEESNRKLEVQAKGIQSEIANWFESKNKEFQVNFFTSVGISSQDTAELMAQSLSGNNISDTLINLGGGLLKDRKVVEKGLEQLLLSGRKYGIGGLKGKWGSTLTKWAGKAAPFINIAVGLFEVFMASSRQADENAARQSQELQIARNVERISSDLSESLRKEIAVSIADYYGEPIATFENEVNEYSTELGDYDSDYNKLMKLKQKLSAVYVN